MAAKRSQRASYPPSGQAFPAIPGRQQGVTTIQSGVAERKADHLQINVEQDVHSQIRSGFGRYRFVNRALPEIDLADVDTRLDLFGRALRSPFLISCMTGGTPEAREINRRLARVADEHGFAMGLGSGRALLEDEGLLSTFAVRDVAPKALLFANLGAVQLKRGYDADHCRRLVEMLDADALALHLNAVQEAVQPEGEPEFSGLLARIADVCAASEVPVVVKEVGWGIAGDDVRRLIDAGAAAVDVAGAGGTSWSEVERHRIREPWRREVAAAFADWGIPTAEAVREARAAAPAAVIIASGGIGGGIDAAKAIALGADLAGMAGPFLRAADVSEEAAAELARACAQTLRIAMFAIGARTLRDLRLTDRLRAVESAK